MPDKAEFGRHNFQINGAEWDLNLERAHIFGFTSSQYPRFTQTSVHVTQHVHVMNAYYTYTCHMNFLTKYHLPSQELVTHLASSLPRACKRRLSHRKYDCLLLQSKNR